jgi:hypothetical protein
LPPTFGHSANVLVVDDVVALVVVVLLVDVLVVVAPGPRKRWP